jgi:hypothetical protein
MNEAEAEAKLMKKENKVAIKQIDSETGKE